VDVLKDVKNAEAEAERIAADYRQRAKDLTDTIASELGATREKRLAAVEEQLQQHRDELHRKIAADRKQVTSDGERRVGELEQEAARRRDDAIAALVGKLESA